MIPALWRGEAGGSVNSRLSRCRIAQIYTEATSHRTKIKSNNEAYKIKRGLLCVCHWAPEPVNRLFVAKDQRRKHPFP